MFDQQALLLQLLHEAWETDPRLALYYASRFPSANLHNEMRALVLKYPDELVEVPDALQVLIGAAMPSDISTQLRVRSLTRAVFPSVANDRSNCSIGHPSIQ